jgi:hypothetical protein
MDAESRAVPVSMEAVVVVADAAEGAAGFAWGEPAGVVEGVTCAGLAAEEVVQRSAAAVKRNGGLPGDLGSGERMVEALRVFAPLRMSASGGVVAAAVAVAGRGTEGEAGAARAAWQAANWKGFGARTCPTVA